MSIFRKGDFVKPRRTYTLTIYWPENCDFAGGTKYRWKGINDDEVSMFLTALGLTWTNPNVSLVQE